MELDDVVIHKKYICDYEGAGYFAIAVDKNSRRVCVSLGDKVDENGDPGDPTESLAGTLAPIWVPADRLREM